MKKRVKFVKKCSIALLGLVAGLTVFVAANTLLPQAAAAQTSPDQFNNTDSTTACPPGQYMNEGIPCATPREIKISPSNSPSLIDQLLEPFITLMTALVGVIIAISLVAAGITYSSAGGDPGKVAAAKKRITNSIIALIAYIFTFGLIQWLVPGGVI